MQQFDDYTRFTGCDTVIADMRPGLVVRFDILASTHWAMDSFNLK
jgi:hypothetical protein